MAEDMPSCRLGLSRGTVKYLLAWNKNPRDNASLYESSTEFQAERSRMLQNNVAFPFFYRSKLGERHPQLLISFLNSLPKE
jgi:hypothetical protein